MEQSVRLTLMRHGRSGGDDEEVHEGRYDALLTPVGQAQVRRRAEQWQSQGLRPDLVVASPLLRAHMSAQIVSEVLDVALELDPDWMEMDNGPTAGLPFDVAEQRYPTPAFRNPYQPFCGSGESEWEIYCRAARAIERVLRRDLGHILVVAHGGILNAALRSIVGAPPTPSVRGARQGIVFALGDAGYVQLRYEPQQHCWVIKELLME